MTARDLFPYMRDGRGSAPRVRVAMSLVLLYCAFGPLCVVAQNIVKWTDENGQVHYSDHAPPGTTSVGVALPKAPRVTETPRSTATKLLVGGDNPVAGGTRQNSDMDERTTRANVAERELAARQQRYRDAQAAADKKADKETLDNCKANRETYCNKGADAIREREQLNASMQYGAAIDERSRLAERGIRVPKPVEPQHVPSRTKVCVKDKCKYEGPVK